MRRTVGLLVGGLLGGGLGLAAVGVLGQLGDGAILRSRVAMIVATPAAHVLSWISGWPLEQEAALVCYALGLLATFAVVGAAAGAISGALVAGRSLPTSRDPA